MRQAIPGCSASVLPGPVVASRGTRQTDDERDPRDLRAEGL